MNNSKRPPTITFLLIWISYMILRGFLKLINVEKIEQNKQIFGWFAIVNYWIDIAILIVFIIILFSFIKRRANTWKYFIGLIIFLIIGTIVGQIIAFTHADKIIALVGEDLPLSIFLISSVISSIFLITFYVFIAIVTYRKRRYFNK